MLLHARLKYLIGDCVLTAAMLTDLLAAEPPAEVRYPTVAWFVEALVHLDELDRAESVLVANDLVGPVGDLPGGAAVLAARAAVWMATGRVQQALDGYLECGRRLAAARVTNPAVIPWRSRAAMSALTLSRMDLAAALAGDELVAARRWGSSAAIGAALHPLGLSREGDQGVEMLTDAATLLRVANVPYEYVWVLHDLGLVLRKNNDPGTARAHLESARDFARRHHSRYWARQAQSALDTMATSSALTRQEARIVSWPPPATATAR
ncbi:hypothetical protein GCM10029964_038110 [Kibdelosporangium lantanae]